ncbi:MAG: 4Fe-4S dicluster domain-containing protein [Dehalococcoidales bacterium]|nr:4Fe-4S dicluster domain-containing protein [Dehalococcoidales bacterium]
MAKGVLYDATKCIGCRGCQTACKQWNQMPSTTTHNYGTYENPPHLSATNLTKIRFTETEDNSKLHFVFTKLQCMHCEEPACVTACPVSALQKHPEGAVTYDDKRCFGCRYCMTACPFGIPSFQWDTPTPWIRKCTFCFDRQSGGLKPACVTTCPTGALKFGEREELLAEAHSRIQASPDKYVDHIYGEHEVGGTCWLYLSPVPFEKIGFPTLQTEAVVVNAERAMSYVLPVLGGMAILMTGLYWYNKRREENALKEAAKKDKQEVAKK